MSNVSGSQVDITEDQTTPEQLREAFRGIANDKVNKETKSYYRGVLNFYFLQAAVTELDLRVAHLPASAIEYLREVMPTTGGVNGDGVEYDYEAWLDSVFADV